MTPCACAECLWAQRALYDPTFPYFPPTTKDMKTKKKSPDAERCYVMDVARLTGRSYQRARDLMLSGKIGNVKLDETKKLYVTPADIKQFLKVENAPAGAAT